MTLRPVFFLVAFTVSALLASTTPADAQRREATRFITPTVHADPGTTSRNAGATRLGASAGGLLAGAIVGGFVGYNVLPHTCNCDDPGLDQIIYGALAGGALGAAFGAAYPRLQSKCTLQERFRRSLIGAGIGAAAGLLLSGRSEAILMLGPAGSVGGALVGLGHCWNSASSE